MAKVKLHNSIRDSVKKHTSDSYQNVLARLGYNTANVMEGTQYPMTRLSRQYQLLMSLYRNHWIIGAVVDTVAEDMVKNWIQITTQVEPSLLERIKDIEHKTALQIEECLKWARLFGGAIGIMVVASDDGMLEQPLEINTVMPSDFCGLIVKHRWEVAPSSELVTDVRSSDFGYPKYYSLNSDDSMKCNMVHHSRVIRFSGIKMPQWEKQAEQYWGISEVERVFDELKKRDNASWNMALLLFQANLKVLKTSDLAQMMTVGGQKNQEDVYRTIQAQNQLMTSFGMLLLNENDGYETHQYTFSGIPDLYDRFMMDIAGAAGIPVTKLFKRSPAGMNATGESDENDYYDMIGRKQTSQLRCQLRKLLPVLCMSEWGFVPDDLDFKFNPVNRPSLNENAELTKSTVDSVTTLYNAGLLPQRTALQELRQLRDTTGFGSNITDEDIARARTDTDTGEVMPALGFLK